MEDAIRSAPRLASLAGPVSGVLRSIERFEPAHGEWALSESDYKAIARDWVRGEGGKPQTELDEPIAFWSTPSSTTRRRWRRRA